jgi:hypothetical protein
VHADNTDQQIQTCDCQTMVDISLLKRSRMAGKGRGRTWTAVFVLTWCWIFFQSRVYLSCRWHDFMHSITVAEDEHLCIVQTHKAASQAALDSIWLDHWTDAAQQEAQGPSLRAAGSTVIMLTA